MVTTMNRGVWVGRNCKCTGNERLSVLQEALTDSYNEDDVPGVGDRRRGLVVVRGGHVLSAQDVETLIETQQSGLTGGLQQQEVGLRTSHPEACEEDTRNVNIFSHYLFTLRSVKVA